MSDENLCNSERAELKRRTEAAEEEARKRNEERKAREVEERAYNVEVAKQRITVAKENIRQIVDTLKNAESALGDQLRVLNNPHSGDFLADKACAKIHNVAKAVHFTTTQAFDVSRALWFE